MSQKEYRVRLVFDTSEIPQGPSGSHTGAGSTGGHDVSRGNPPPASSMPPPAEKHKGLNWGDAGKIALSDYAMVKMFTNKQKQIGSDISGQKQIGSDVSGQKLLPKQPTIYFGNDGSIRSRYGTRLMFQGGDGQYRESPAYDEKVGRIPTTGKVIGSIPADSGTTSDTTSTIGGGKFRHFGGGFKHTGGFKHFGGGFKHTGGFGGGAGGGGGGGGGGFNPFNWFKGWFGGGGGGGAGVGGAAAAGVSGAGRTAAGAAASSMWGTLLKGAGTLGGLAGLGRFSSLARTLAGTLAGSLAGAIGGALFAIFAVGKIISNFANKMNEDAAPYSVRAAEAVVWQKKFEIRSAKSKEAHWGWTTKVGQFFDDMLVGFRDHILSWPLDSIGFNIDPVEEVRPTNLPVTGDGKLPGVNKGGTSDPNSKRSPMMDSWQSPVPQIVTGPNNLYLGMNANLDMRKGIYEATSQLRDYLLYNIDKGMNETTLFMNELKSINYIKQI